MNRAADRPLAVVLGLGLLATGWILLNGVVYDAARLLHGDPRLTVPLDWIGLATAPYWPGALFRPVTLLLLGLQTWIGGGVVPPIYHAVSLVLYGGVLVLLVRLLQRFGVGPVVTLLAAALFAVHPVHVEVVASIVGQAELLVAGCLLIAIAAWDRAAEVGPEPRHLLILTGALVVGALSKEQGFLLPVVLLGQQLLLPRRLPTPIARRWLVLLAGIAVALWAVHWQVTGTPGGEIPAAPFLGLSWSHRALIALGVVPEAARVMFFPLHLQADYAPPGLPAESIVGWRQLLGALLLVAALMAIWRTRRERPLTAFGLWVAGVTWLPVSSLVVPAGLLLGERVLFLPSLGLAIAVAGWWLDRPAPRRTAMLVGWGLVMLFTVRSAVRCRAWHDQTTFFEAMVRDAPRAYHGWFLRGVWMRTTGELAEAEASQRRALSLWAGDPAVHEELGQLLRSEDRCDEAIPVLRDGLVRDPYRTQVRAKLGECLLTVGDSTAAATVARDGMALGDSTFRELLERAGGE